MVVVKPACGAAAALRYPGVWLGGDEWPAAIPCALTLALLAAGLALVFTRRGPIAWLQGMLWLTGAGFFADVPLEAAGWPMFGSALLFVAVAAALFAALARAEWRAAEPRPISVVLFLAVSLPFVELLGKLPDPLFYANGALACGLIAWCLRDSLTRYRPLEAT